MNFFTINIWRDILAVLCILDTLCTTLFVMGAGIEAEANPIMRAVLEFGGIPGFIIVKLLTVALIWFALSKAPEKRWILIAAITLTVIMAYVCVMGAKMVALVHFGII